MTADALKKILWLHMYDSADLDYIMSCVDKYSRSQNSGEANVSGSSIPVAEQSMDTMFDEDYKKLKQQQCSHPDIGTDGGGDYCKSCGKRWSR